jgi:3-dehydro-L-gulonate 2-dehydrogenase
MDSYLRIPADQMRSEFERILVAHGFNNTDARRCAEIFTDNSLEGVYSHGVNRFPRFVKNVREQFIQPGAIPSLKSKTGAIEQWNGNLGPGPLNAFFATERVIELAEENSLGLVAMAHTNHWMRGGTYGWHAARRGYVMICWTNTCPNMPAWGAKDPRLGNNPMIVAIPYGNDAIVLDFAMSQYSYGKIEALNAENKLLPYPGGFSKNDELTVVPSEILESWRILPAGYWKGSGLSLVLDILAAVLSDGLSTHEIKTCTNEYNVSQVFIAICIRKLQNFPLIDDCIGRIVNDLRKSIPADNNISIRYPGEITGTIRSENLAMGIPVSCELWKKILSL